MAEPGHDVVSDPGGTIPDMSSPATATPDGMLPGMPTRLFAATPTRLVTWLRCRRRYRMTYLDRPSPQRGAPWAHSSMGAAVHTALARWWQEPPATRTPGRAAALLAACWTSPGFRDDAQSDRWRDSSAQTVAGYVATLEPAAEPRGVERTVALRTPRLALSGRVDRIDERPDTDGEPELVVVDYKTGRSVPDTDEARTSLALAVYAAAAGRTLRRPASLVELHHLPTGRVIGWRHGPAGLARHLARADDIGAEVAAAHAAYRRLTGAGEGGSDGPAADRLFAPSPGPACSWCDVRSHCPEGRRVSADLPSWAGLADDPIGAGSPPGAQVAVTSRPDRREQGRTATGGWTRTGVVR